ncbi:MAG: ABC transporter substrate-binding protein [marine bacterium B5-7]|nr:MAG: ABC transporter substrate-binding protein [marine bacterium B5-7]
MLNKSITTARAACLAGALCTLVFIQANAFAASTLVYCSEASPEGFNPAIYTSITTWDASSKPIFNRLLEFKPGSLEIVPALAESWVASDDGLAYTFDLRKGVHFHNQAYFSPTRDFNADDVVFSVNRMLDPEHPYHHVGRGVYPVFESLGMDEVISRVEKLGPYRVRFHLSQPLAPFLANIAMDFMSIQSAEYAEKLQATGEEDQIDYQPIGTGPFLLESYRKDASISYRANKLYWDGAPEIDRLIYDITPDASVRYQKLINGECHVMGYPHPADLKSMRTNPEVRVLEAPGHNIGYLAFNTLKPPLDNVLVRRALALSIDREAILESVYLGNAIIADNPIPPTLKAWSEATPKLTQQVDEARSLLKKAGYANGFDIELWAMPVQRAYNPNARRMAELIQADWNKIGVNAKIVSYEWGEYLSRSRNGEHEAILLGWTGQNADADNFLYTMLSCASVNDANRARWCDPIFDDLIRRARQENDTTIRNALYKKAQAVFFKQMPWLPIAHSKGIVVIRKNVTGYKIDPLGGQRFNQVRLEN